MARVLKLLVVTNEIEARFSVRLFESPLIVVRAQRQVAVITDRKWLLLYPDALFGTISTGVFTNAHLTKLVCTPLSKLKQHYGLEECVNCHHINEYVCGKGGTKLLPELKALITQAHDLDNAAQRIASIIMLYQEDVDARPPKPVPAPKKPRIPSSAPAPVRLHSPAPVRLHSPAPVRHTFNRKRDAYLQYLTIFNDILSTTSVPLTVVELAQAADDYPNLCRMAMTSLEALESCIQAGALHYDPNDSTVKLIPGP
jgi:hypothetical protein